jgi:hypothetical protein
MLIAATAGASTVAGQGRSSIVGLVVSGGTGSPIHGVRIVVKRPSAIDTTLLTDAEGRFALQRLAAGRYSVQASWNDFKSLPALVDLRRNEKFELEFTVSDLSPAPTDPRTQVLPELVTEARKGPSPEGRTFERRMAKGLGQYLAQDQIEERNATRLTDLLRMFKGVGVTCDRAACVPRIERAPRGCGPPRFYLDETVVDAAIATATPPSEIRGIEVYQGLAQVPGELAQDHRAARCGVIVVWTRRGPEPGKPPA